MSPLPSSLISAARSGEVRGACFAVFVELHEWLDGEEFRTVAPWKIAELIHVDEAQVYRAIETLLRLGYLEQGERFGNARTFKIAQRSECAA